MSAHRSGVWVVAATALALLLPLALVVGFVIAAPHALDELDPQQEPQYAPVVTVEFTHSTQGLLMLEFASPHEVLAGTTNGLVTAITVEPGDVLQAGDQVATVDGVGLIAYDPARQGVIFADACGSPDGDQRSSMTAVMNSAGVLRDSHPSFRAQVRQFQRELGISEPDGCFRLDYLLPLPTESVMVGHIHLRLGQPFPGQGSVVVTEAPMLASVTLRTEGFQGGAGHYVVIFQGREAPVERREDRWVVDPSALAPLLDGVSTADGGTVLDVRVRAVAAEFAMSVPPASILVGESGTTCVAMLVDGALEVLPIHVIGNAPSGAAAIAHVAELDDAHVLSNPLASSSDVTCP